MAERLLSENRMDIVVEAFLTEPSVTKVAKKTGVPRNTIYYLMKKPEFQEKMAEARQRSMDKAITYMQGSLLECAEVLMGIIKDDSNPAQTRIYAINTLLQNCKGLVNDSNTVAGMAVTIVDSI